MTSGVKLFRPAGNHFSHPPLRISLICAA